MLCVTCVYARDITNTNVVILHLNVSRLSVRSSCSSFLFLLLVPPSCSLVFLPRPCSYRWSMVYQWTRCLNTSCGQITFQYDYLFDSLFHPQANRAGQGIWRESAGGWEIRSPWQRHDGPRLLPITGNHETRFSRYSREDVQFSSVLWDQLGGRGDLRDDSANFLFQSFLQEAIVSSSGMGRDVHSLMLSIQHFLCLLQRRLPSKVPGGIILERLSLRLTCPNHASFRLWTVAWRGSCGPTRKLILLPTQSLVLCSK